MSGSVASEIQKLNPTAELDLWELDVRPLGGVLFRFHCGTNKLGGSVVWQGNTYQPMPIVAEGLEITSKGTIPRPTLKVANLDGIVATQARMFADFVGCTVIRRRTMARFLDAVNFPGGVNADADPTEQIAPDVYRVEQKTGESPEGLIFQLSAPMDTQGLMIPARQIQATICPSAYKGVECGYSGALASCSKLLDLDGTKNGCGAHFNPNPLPFGGFPGSGLA